MRVDDRVVVRELKELRRRVGAGLRRPVEEPDVEQVHAGAEERHEAEGGAESELQVGGEERVERPLEVEDALRTLVEQPHELVEVDLAVAIGVAEIRADRAPQAACRPRLGDDHIQFGRRADRGGERHFRRVAAAVDVGQIDAVSKLLGIHLFAGERQPDAAGVVADVDICVELHAAEDPGEERGEDRKRLLKAEADVRQVGHVPRDEIDVLAEEQAEGGGERVVEDWEGDLAIVELLELPEGTHALLAGGGGLVGLERRGSHGSLAEEQRLRVVEHRERAEREPARRGCPCQRVGNRCDIADRLQEFLGLRPRICVVGFHEREERHRAQASLLRHVGDDRHLGQQQVDHRPDRLEQVIDLAEQVLDRTAEQAAQIDADVGDLEIEAVGEAGGEVGELRELDRFVRRRTVARPGRHLRETGVERGREAGEAACTGIKQIRLQVEVEPGPQTALEVGRHEGGRDLRERERPADAAGGARIEVGGERGHEFRLVTRVGRRELDRTEADAESRVIEFQAGRHGHLVRLVRGRAQRLDEEALEPAEAQADVEHEIEVERGRTAEGDPEPVEADVEFALADRDLPRALHRDREDHAVTQPQLSPVIRQVGAGLRAVAGNLDRDATVPARRMNAQDGRAVKVARLRDVLAVVVLDVLTTPVGDGVIERLGIIKVQAPDERTDIFEERHLGKVDSANQRQLRELLRQEVIRDVGHEPADQFLPEVGVEGDVRKESVKVDVVGNEVGRHVERGGAGGGFGERGLEPGRAERTIRHHRCREERQHRLEVGVAVGGEREGGRSAGGRIRRGREPDRGRRLGGADGDVGQAAERRGEREAGLVDALDRRGEIGMCSRRHEDRRVRREVPADLGRERAAKRILQLACAGDLEGQRRAADRDVERGEIKRPLHAGKVDLDVEENLTGRAGDAAAGVVAARTAFPRRHFHLWAIRLTTRATTRARIVAITESAADRIGQPAGE